MKINENIRNILEQGIFKGNIYLLPDIQLDRKDYQEVNKVLMSLGWKWKTRVWHIFTWTQEELEWALFEVLEKWETQTLEEIKKQFQYFPTPKELAKKVIDLADLWRNDRILEPSAWQWAIVNQIDKDSEELILIELDPKNCKMLADQWYNPINIDFLEYKNSWYYTKIIANPPFSKNQDVKHILHMYDLLAEWWRIVSIASSMIEHKETKYHKELMKLNPEFIKVEEWAFKDSWTMVSTVIVVINK